MFPGGLVSLLSLKLDGVVGVGFGWTCPGGEMLDLGLKVPFTSRISFLSFDSTETIKKNFYSSQRSPSNSEVKNTNTLYDITSRPWIFYDICIFTYIEGDQFSL